MLNPKAVEGCLKNARSQGHFTVNMYKMVYKKRWKDIENVEGWPTVTKATALRIFGMVEKKYPDNMLGAWFNNGFSCQDAPEDLKDWEVIPAEYTLQEGK
jgi:hypothetical protein